MQSIIDACRTRRLQAEIAVVISNNSNAQALVRASDAGIPAFNFSTRTHPKPTELDAAISQTLLKHGVDILFLAGYLRKIGPVTLSRFAG
jgi:phosphoribosylglycinamide formyltransferase-1